MSYWKNKIKWIICIFRFFKLTFSSLSFVSIIYICILHIERNNIWKGNFSLCGVMCAFFFPPFFFPLELNDLYILVEVKKLGDIKNSKKTFNVKNLVFYYVFGSVSIRKACFVVFSSLWNSYRERYWLIVTCTTVMWLLVVWL